MFASCAKVCLWEGVNPSPPPSPPQCCESPVATESLETLRSASGWMCQFSPLLWAQNDAHISVHVVLKDIILWRNIFTALYKSWIFFKFIF